MPVRGLLDRLFGRRTLYPVARFEFPPIEDYLEERPAPREPAVVARFATAGVTWQQDGRSGPPTEFRA